MTNKELQDRLKQFPDSINVWIDIRIITNGIRSANHCQHIILPTDVQIKHSGGFSTVSLIAEDKK